MNTNTALVVWQPGFIKDYLPYVDPKNAIIAHRYILTKGWLVVVIKQLFNYRLAVSYENPNFYDDMWCYANNDPIQAYVDVMVAFALWDPVIMPEPPGWIRNPTTGRRRSYDEDGRMTEWIAG